MAIHEPRTAAADLARAGVPAIALMGITKRFPGVIANDDISLDFREGEIHVLLGENGAGKSTLIGVLAGMQQPDGGEIQINGRPARISSPRESLRLGIGTVFQHVLLVPSLTVIENLMLGGRWFRKLDRAEALTRFEELSQILAVEIDADVEVGRLSLGQQQQVEIIRALWHGGKVLILDEPTSMLTPQGVKELGAVMRRLRDQGVAIVFITHKLGEAYEFGDRISVLRLGKLVGDIPPERLDVMNEEAATNEIIRLMFGTGGLDGADVDVFVHEGEQRRRKRSFDPARPPALSVQAISTDAEPGEGALREVSFEVRPGEIFGIAGVDGNGQKHLAETLAGQRPVSSGEILIDKAPVRHLGVAGRRRLGVRYITDDRVGEGTVGGHSVATNLVLKEIGRAPHWRHGISRWRRIFHHAREMIQRHDIRTPSEHTPLGRLSGGNIQKVLLARELSSEAKIVIFSKPTYGLDLHNIRLAREAIVQAAEAGRAVVLISTELEELMELSDRIGVMFGGALTGIVENDTGAESIIGRLMTGAEAA